MTNYFLLSLSLLFSINIFAMELGIKSEKENKEKFSDQTDERYEKLAQQKTWRTKLSPIEKNNSDSTAQTSETSLFYNVPQAVLQNDFGAYLSTTDKRTLITTSKKLYWIFIDQVDREEVEQKVKDYIRKRCENISRENIVNFKKTRINSDSHSFLIVKKGLPFKAEYVKPSDDIPSLCDGCQQDIMCQNCSNAIKQTCLATILIKNKRGNLFNIFNTLFPSNPCIIYKAPKEKLVNGLNKNYIRYISLLATVIDPLLASNILLLNGAIIFDGNRDNIIRNLVLSNNKKLIELINEEDARRKENNERPLIAQSLDQKALEHLIFEEWNQDAVKTLIKNSGKNIVQSESNGSIIASEIGTAINRNELETFILFKTNNGKKPLSSSREKLIQRFGLSPESLTHLDHCFSPQPLVQQQTSAQPQPLVPPRKIVKAKRKS